MVTTMLKDLSSSDAWTDESPKIHEVWTFGEDGVTRAFHPTVQLDVVSGLVGEFSTDYLTEIWCRVPIFGINSINVSVEWLGVPDFFRTYGPAWNANLLSLRLPN